MNADFAADTVWWIHLVFVAWMVYAPFSGVDEFVAMHALAVCPVLLLHWAMHTDGCALTVLEAYLRGLDDARTGFVHGIVAPVYVIEDAELKNLVVAVTLGLWAVSLSRLRKTPTWTAVCRVVGASA